MREEVVLALDLYLNRDGLHDAAARRGLSQLLREWPAEREFALADPTFRNEQSVRNKLYNLQYLETGGTQGREKGGAVTNAVWEEFGGNAAAAAAEAAVIRTAIQDLESADPEPGVEGDLEADETGVVLLTHRRRERSRKLVAKKKAAALSQTGALACEACGFDSEARYGIQGVIECHHLKPVAELQPGETTKLSELRLVCPNCHRLVHRRRPWLSWPELLALVASP
jgi:5-methylcytosine-specific restriction protein A